MLMRAESAGEIGRAILAEGSRGMFVQSKQWQSLYSVDEHQHFLALIIGIECLRSCHLMVASRSLPVNNSVLEAVSAAAGRRQIKTTTMAYCKPKQTGVLSGARAPVQACHRQPRFQVRVINELDH
jgi:hypothetical protein